MLEQKPERNPVVSTCSVKRQFTEHEREKKKYNKNLRQNATSWASGIILIFVSSLPGFYKNNNSKEKNLSNEDFFNTSPKGGDNLNPRHDFQFPALENGSSDLIGITSDINMTNLLLKIYK